MQIPERREQIREDNIPRKRRRDEQNPEEQQQERPPKRKKLEEQNPDKQEESSCLKKREQEETEEEQHNPEEEEKEEEEEEAKAAMKDDQKEWLECLLETRFYDKCEKHASTRCNFFCKDCKGNAFCKYDSHQHIGHQIIQVYKASDHPGVRIKAIKELVDISDVQLYSINSFGIVYITPRQRKGNDENRELLKVSGIGMEEVLHLWKRTCGSETIPYQLQVLFYQVQSCKNFLGLQIITFYYQVQSSFNISVWGLIVWQKAKSNKEVRRSEEKEKD